MRWSARVVAAALALSALVLAVAASGAAAEEIHYAIEIGGTLCGYSVVSTSEEEIDDVPRLVVKQRFFAMLSALGSRFNSEVRLTYHLDPVTGAFSYHDSDVKQGQVRLDSKISVRNGKAYATSSLSAQEKVVDLPDGVVLPNTHWLPWLRVDFVEGGVSEKTYAVFEVRELTVHETSFKRVGREKLELSVGAFDAVVLESLNLATGLKAKLWIRACDGRLLKTVATGNRRMTLTDASVVKRIEMANLDETILRKTNVQIADFSAISYLEVKAVIEPSGLWVTPESLNVPGQKFTGTVEENRVEGVFEVELPRYSGEGAPPFPTPFAKDAPLSRWLGATEFIDPGDPVLRARAVKLTAGAKDSWDAACRLSRWVAENIDYAIPGGGTPRKTYEIRAGECGAHSHLLASFCRAVGIPARVVWGCMYVPSLGGAFGQHAWNEIYMGEAGWIPVDSTASETDYADSGHIRLGVLEGTSVSLNAVSMEILDHRLRPGEAAGNGEDPATKYREYLGTYTLAARGMTVKVLVSGGGLAVDIPGPTVLALKDADAAGRFYARLSNRVFCDFVRDGAGAVKTLRIHEIVRLAKRSSPEAIDEAVPEELRRYLGKYLFAPRNVEFEVIFRDGGLAIDDPLAKKIVKLRPPDAKGRFVDEFGKNSMTFEEHEDGRIARLVIDATSRFARDPE